MEKKPISFGKIIVVFAVIAVGMNATRKLLYGDEPASPPVAITPKVVNPYCKTPKKDGTIDPRVCDLSELCKDWVFYRKKAIESEAKGDKANAYEAQKSFFAVNFNISEYKDEDVSACLSKNGG